MPEANPALDRIEKLIEEWASNNVEKANRADFEMWSLNGKKLDLRDLQLLVAAAKGEGGDTFGYLEWGERSIKGWMASNANQARSLSRLSEQRTEVMKIIGGAYGDRYPTAESKLQAIKEAHHGNLPG